ncbi:hypothetical protein BpHYR1_019034 [Brachionus plicatilis]|uniref:Uncharacterized protein n=1 Tax=Brachionus plicatilis TaxID=10195 RepID=A0A3M7SG80_BRAPC|nr:hypothetical protein BpHYR1_019034 [Brachionus plicatilis]
MMVHAIVAKHLWDHCKIHGSVLEPLNETLETCVGGLVKVIGRGKFSSKSIEFESEVDIIVVDELVNDCVQFRSLCHKKNVVTSKLVCLNYTLTVMMSNKLSNKLKGPRKCGNSSSTDRNSRKIGVSFNLAGPNAAKNLGRDFGQSNHRRTAKFTANFKMDGHFGGQTGGKFFA